MSCYTLCDCIFEKFDRLAKTHISDMLWIFTQSNAHKIAVDESDRILNLYHSYGEKNQVIAFWIKQMAREPDYFQPIPVNVNDVADTDELFLRVCSATRECKKAIVFDHNRWQNYAYSETSFIIYNDTPIKILDRDEAVEELKPVNVRIGTVKDSTFTAAGNINKK